MGLRLPVAGGNPHAADGRPPIPPESHRLSPGPSWFRRASSPVRRAGRLTRCDTSLLRGLSVLVLLCVVAGTASAHRLSPAFFGLTEIEPNTFNAQWKVSISGGLADAMQPQVPAGCEVVGGVRTYAVEDARIDHGRISCDEPLPGKLLEVNGLAATQTDVLLRVDYLDGSSFTHRLVPESPSVVIPEEAGALAVAATYLVLGVEHILLGIDHLLFVLALLLLVRGLGRLVITVTAFTVAHSITLGAATLGFVNVPIAPVEATIALSIVFVAMELARGEVGVAGFGANAASGGVAAAPPGAGQFAGRRANASLTTRFPWIVAFTFGLLHGFGFAGALSEVGLPQSAIPLALLFFNVGVELGQLMFIAAVLLLGWGLRYVSVPIPRWSRQLSAYVIGSVAAFWVFERTVSVI